MFMAMPASTRRWHLLRDVIKVSASFCWCGRKLADGYTCPRRLGGDL
jgi:hypothetical protein